MTTMAERLQTAIESAETTSNSLMLRVSTWAAVGNGGALLLGLNAVLDGRICNWGETRAVVATFAAGLIAAVLSVYFDGRAHALLARTLTAMRNGADWLDSAEERTQDISKVTVADARQLKSELIRERAAFNAIPDDPLIGRFERRARDLLFLSGILWIGSVLWVLYDDRFIAALCTPQ